MGGQALEMAKKAKSTKLANRPPDELRRIADSLIDEVRGHRVIFDADVAEFYGRTTSAVNQQRSRNPDRFPADYAFQLKPEEWADLASQNVTASVDGGRR